MAQLVWTEPALMDLDEIAEYIALDDPAAASNYVQKVFDRVERLATYPNSGKRPAELLIVKRFGPVVRSVGVVGQ